MHGGGMDGGDPGGGGTVGVCLVAEEVTVVPQLTAPSPPRPDSEKAWSSAGHTSSTSEDPMQQYVSEEG